ncbi:MAG: right-handed parallel beta-helix repeat-containing protein [Propionicimonas sp.]
MTLTLVETIPPSPAAAASPQTSRTVTATATKLGYVSKSSPKKKFSTKSTLRASKSAYAAYLSFAPVKLASGEKIVSVTLQVQVTSLTGKKKAKLQVTPVKGGWTPSKLTYRNRPATAGSKVGVSATVKKAKLVSITLDPAKVSKLVTSGASFRLTNQLADSSVKLSTKGSKAPRLIIKTKVPTLNDVPAPQPTPTATPKPTATATPQPTATPTPTQTATPSTPASNPSAGSLPVGSADYAVPQGAIFVATNGNDNNAGTQAAPYRTIAKAIAKAPSGATIVVRKGVYHESVKVYGKTLTIQNYPKEAVWLDGTTPVTGWAADGKLWRKTGWTTRFDHSPTFTQGAPDNTAEFWRFVNPDYPMASHPDQVFINGTAQQQVKSKSLVGPGKFYLDESSSTLYLGSDPTGKTVEASTIIKALALQGKNSVLRGIGVRRFSPSVFHMGSITIEEPGVRLENVVVEDSATTGISVQDPDVKLTRVTVQRSGMLGIHARYADRVVFDRVLSTKNNVERFNVAPTAGGAKIGKSRGITVVNSSFSGNYAHGFWEDLSCYDSVIRQSTFNDNQGDGLFLEISAKAIVGDNLFAGNDEFGIKVNNTTNVEIWNNTFAGNGRPLNIVQDARRNTDKNDQAVDPRVAFPDPTMPWTLGPVTIRNNVVADSSSAADCLLCVEDYSRSKSAADMKITANGNVYHRSKASSPKWLAIWSQGKANPLTFTSLAELKSKTGQEATGQEHTGSSILDKNFKLVSSVSGNASKVAQPLPDHIAKAIGRPAGAKVIGRW